MDADTKFLSELLGESSFDSLYDAGIEDVDPTAEFTCKFCKKPFNFDADTAEMRGYAKNYGCGCVPEPVADFIMDNEIKTLETLRIKRVNSWDNDYIFTINNKRYNYNDKYSSHHWELSQWINKNGEETIAYA